MPQAPIVADFPARRRHNARKRLRISASSVPSSRRQSRYPPSQRRASAGLTAARERGRKGGRPKSLTENKVAMARQLYADKSNSVEEICKTLGISRATLWRYVKEK